MKFALVLAAQLIGAFVLLVGGIAGPQWVYFASGSVVLAVLVGFGVIVAWSALMVWAGKTLKMGLVAAGLGAAVIAIAPLPGTKDFQMGLGLMKGRSLDGVGLHWVLSEGEENMWVRLDDARVRSEVTKRLDFVSGDRKSQTHSHIVVAPVTLAADVSHEDTTFRRKPTGDVALWACAGDTFAIDEWDRQRQAVRGRLARMESHVRASLNAELAPAMPMPIPGAGMIPAAPGALEAAPEAREQPAVLRAAENAWCVHLDRTLDGKTAQNQATESLLAVVLSVAFFGAGVAVGFSRMTSS